MAKREYNHEGLTVLWDSDLCVHCEECSDILPQVFNPTARPWVDLTKAPRKDIEEVVLNCPSGALKLKEV